MKNVMNTQHIQYQPYQQPHNVGSSPVPNEQGGKNY